MAKIIAAGNAGDLRLPIEAIATRQRETWATAALAGLGMPIGYGGAFLASSPWGGKGRQVCGSDMTETSPSDASTRSMPSPSPRWVLVWCHERCHKSDNEGHRRELGEMCRALGASLICLKKANTFATWLEGGGKKNAGQANLPYVLLSDWREAKPCIEVLSVAQPRQQPLLTMLLCEEPRLFQRASMWVSSRTPTAGRILVSKDLQNVRVSLSQVARQSLESSPSLKDQEKDKSPATPPEHAAALCFSVIKAVPTAWEAEPRLPAVTQAVCPCTSTKPAPWMLTALMTWSSSAPDHVEHVLKAAMPEIYMD